uniref:Ribosomal protein S2 n=1 Tax=Trebouxiophyceae sp. MX-AZ01 TaxID=1208065 RepID=J7K8E1_9CHLO|nr:ribosomal protein S2 [Trebouxiophyceae sp. MX-AZ01]AFQ93759.1 ribosomal protein S2 [Trebouxiophyceae sp. MX-AZ01]
MANQPISWSKNKQRALRIARLRPLIESSGHVGHGSFKMSSSRLWFPAVLPFLEGRRRGRAVVDPNQTIHQMVKGMFMIVAVLKSGGRVTIIDTREEGASIWNRIERGGDKMPEGVSFSGTKWIGGSITNWESIHRMVRRFAFTYQPFDSFLLKNRIRLPRYERMKRTYPGFLQIKGTEARLRLQRRPDLLVIINPNENRHVINEGVRLNIPIVALIDTTTDSSKITLPIPINSDSLQCPSRFMGMVINLSIALQQSNP